MPADRQPPRVLIVEDDERTARWLVLYLERERMETTVAATAREAVALVESGQPDLVLLDVMLPGGDGFEVSRAIRAMSRVPIIFITARAGEADRLLGFDLGADDYITKPFSPREVVARVRAVLRRAAGDDPPPETRIGGVVLRHDTLTVTRGDTRVKLTPAEARLLQTLMSAPSRVWSRTQLLDRARGSDYSGTERTIDAHVKNLRRKLAQLPAAGRSPLRIVTTHGVGYQLEADDR